MIDSRFRVLVVGDASLRSTPGLQALLDSVDGRPVSVDQVGSIPDAVDRAIAGRYDLYLVSREVDPTDHSKLLRKIRRSEAENPLVLVTGGSESLASPLKHGAEHHLLVVEDSPVDFEALSRALRKSSYEGSLQHCEDGDEALDYLRSEGDFAAVGSSQRPSLVLLDLNLPGTDGREVLHEVKQDRDLRSIPVVMFSTSNNERDIEQCYDAGANSYVIKPSDVSQFADTVQRILYYWCRITNTPVGTGV